MYTQKFVEYLWKAYTYLSDKNEIYDSILWHRIVEWTDLVSGIFKALPIVTIKRYLKKAEIVNSSDI